ncbi:MAG TPA: hypothetical protein ACFCUC_09505 [Desulfobacterales bacterium]
MKSNLLKFLVILSAILFIGTGVSWADGQRGKRHHGRGYDHPRQKTHIHHHYYFHKKHSYDHRRGPHRIFHHHPGCRQKHFQRPGYKHHYPKHHYRQRLNHEPYRNGYHKEHYAFGFSIFEPGVAFGFSVKGQK